MDGLARGFASAITLIGIELARASLPYVDIPDFMLHETGQAHMQLANRLQILVDRCNAHNLSLPQWFEKDISAARDELIYIEEAQQDVLESPDPDDIPESNILGDGSDDIWHRVFSQLCFIQDPKVDNVVVHIACRGTDRMIRLRDSLPITLRWPPALQITAFRLRQLLTNLIKNAVDKTREQQEAQILITITDCKGAAGYVRLDVADNGDAYDAESSQVGRAKRGHRVIRRTILALRKIGYADSAFHRPELGAIGKAKVFSLILPTVNAKPRSR
jgi:hypothetical protein